MAIIAIYDVTGIQKFIFNSNVLRENIGASQYVAAIFRDILPTILQKELKTNKNYIDKPEKFSFLDDNSIESEIVYIGGGNACVVFRNEELMRKFNKKFTKEILKETGGELHIAFGKVETDFKDFSSDFRKLFLELNKDKQSRLPTFFMSGISITREGVSDKLPAIKTIDGDAASYLTVLKNEYKDINVKKYPLSIDDFSGEEGEQFVAVVHIDGNNMGKIIESLLKDVKDYSKAVSRLRELSKYIDNYYKDAFDKAEQKLENNLESIRKKISFNKKGLLPIRPIIQDGDDITFIINSKIALQFTEDLLNGIEGKTIEFDDIKIKLSANAGIAYVKPHFPFYTAYQLAEALCSSSKKKAKALSNDLYIGSWIDFHIQQNVVTSDLNSMRQKEYNLSDIKEAININNDSIHYQCYNLLWRPWRIKSNDKYCFNKLKAIINDFSNKFPKNKIKGIRKALSISAETANFYIKEMESRDNKLPKFLNSNELFKENTNMTPYIDAIELLDFYISY